MRRPDAPYDCIAAGSGPGGLQDGRPVQCECIMSSLGFKLNDGFLAGLDLKRNGRGF